MDKDEIEAFFKELEDEGPQSPGVNTWANIAANDNSLDLFKIDSVDLDLPAWDTTYDLKPETNEPAVYTSHEQRVRHEQYPAVQKAWEDYLTLFALSNGEPPFVE